MMTFTRVPSTVNNRNFKSWTIDCMASDTIGTVAHGFGTVASGICFAWLCNNLTNITTAVPAEWAVVVDPINITVTKNDQR